MPKLGSYERDVELYEIAAKAHRDFRDEHPRMDHLEARALICALEAFRRYAVADALLAAADDLAVALYDADAALFAARWLRERAWKIQGGSDA